MGYVGVPPQSGFITTAKQRVTSSTNNYVDLDHSISSLADVIVWVNFVKQDSTNLSLTTSTRITLGATLVASDIVEIAYLGKAVATQTPDTGTVTNDMLAGSIANSKLATDPLNASNLASGTVPTARLGSGTASSSTVLYGDQTYKTAPSGALTKVGSATTLRNSHGDADIQNCFSSTYDVYLVTYAITMDRDGNSFSFKFGTGTNNAGFLTSGYNYHQFGYPSNGTSINQRYSDPTTKVQLSDGMMGSTSSIMWSAWGNIMIYRPSSTTEFKSFDFRGAWYDTSGHVRTINGAGRNGSTTAITGMRFNPSANYLFSSDIHVYGLET